MAEILFGEEFPLFGSVLAAKLSISAEGLVWSCCESYPDALDTPEMPFGSETCKWGGVLDTL